MHADRDGEGRAAGVAEVLQRAPQLVQRAAGPARDAEDAPDLTAGHLDPDPREEPDQHGAREEVGQEPEPDDPGEDQEAPP